MEGYNINEIEVVDKNKPPLEELLTGDVVKGLDPYSPIKPNAEIEKDEYIQFPDGTTQKVVGRKHEKGGVQMNIPDGTKIVSDSLSPTKEQARKLSEKYNIEVSTKDTFASIIDKYTKKIGLKRLNDEQEEQFSQLKKVLDSKMDNKTSKVNRVYLSKKINDLEKQKEAKEKDRANFFNVVFDMQENNKPAEEKNYGEEGFKKGGISQKNFEAVCKKYGITPEQGMKMLKFGGDYRKFDDGGKQRDWREIILNKETISGSGSGSGLPNFGIQIDKWGQKYDYLKDGVTDAEAIRFINEEYVSQVKDFPEKVQKRLVDYMYNTGRSYEDLLLLASDKLTLDRVNKEATHTDDYNKYKKEILEQAKDPKFLNKIDKSKESLYKTTPDKDANGNIVKIYTLDNPNPAYEATWKDRIYMWGDSKKGDTDRLFKGDEKISKQYEHIKNVTSKPEFQDALYKKYEEAWDDKTKQDENYYKARGSEKYKKLSKEEVVNNYLDMQKRNLAFKAHGLDYKKVGNKASDKNTSKYLREFIKENNLDEEGIELPGYDKTAQEQLSYIAMNDLVTDYNKDKSKYKDLPELETFKVRPIGVGDEKWGSGNISRADGIYTDTTSGEITEVDYDKVNGSTTITKKEGEEDKDREVAKGTAIEDKVTTLPKKNYPKLFMMPDQSTLPPTPMEAHLKAETRLGRIDPIRLGIESQLQDINTQQQYIAEQTEDLPPALRASMLSGILANSQKASNEAIFNTNVANAQNLAQTEIFNAQQASQESLYNTNNALSYEQRQLQAKANTEKDLRDYYNFNREVRLANFQDQQRMNLLDSLFPDFEIDQTGAAINFDPNDPNFQIERRNFLDMYG